MEIIDIAFNDVYSIMDTQYCFVSTVLCLQYIVHSIMDTKGNQLFRREVRARKKPREFDVYIHV